MIPENLDPDLGAAVALRLRGQRDDHAIRDVLVFAAKHRAGNVSNLIGKSQTTKVRSYHCNICGAGIDTESAQHAQTKHASEACKAHLDRHFAALGAVEIRAARAYLRHALGRVYQVGRQPAQGRAMAELTKLYVRVADLLSDGLASEWAHVADAYYEEHLRQPAQRRKEARARIEKLVFELVELPEHEVIDHPYGMLPPEPPGSIVLSMPRGTYILTGTGAQPALIAHWHTEHLADGRDVLRERRWVCQELAPALAEYAANAPRFI